MLPQRPHHGIAKSLLLRLAPPDAKRMGLRKPKLTRAEPKPVEKPQPVKAKKPTRKDAELQFAQDALVIPKDGLALSDGERTILALENANIQPTAKMLGQEGVPKAQIDVLTPAEKVVHITRRIRAPR